MISLAAAAKAGAVCMALVSDRVLFCALPAAPKAVLVCTKEGCRTPAELARLSPAAHARFQQQIYEEGR